MSYDSTGGASRRSEYPPVFSSRGFARFVERLIGRNVLLRDMSEVYRVYESLVFNDVFPYVAFLKSCEGTSNLVRFHDVLGLLTFERELQAVMLAAIGVIEKQSKAQYRNVMTESAGDFCLYDSRLFRDGGFHRSSLQAIDRCSKVRARKDCQLRAMLDSSERVPCDFVLGACSLGTFSRLVGNTRDASAVAAVAASFGLDVRRLVSWLRTLTAVRNACAHFDAYNVKGQIPSVPRRVPGADGDPTKPLYALLVIARMLEGRSRFLGRAGDDAFDRFDEGARRCVAALERERPRLVDALGVPEEFRTPVARAPLRSQIAFSSDVRYWAVPLAA